MPNYLLIRRLPDGVIKSHSMTFASGNKAARAAGVVLYDNAGVQMAVAQRFSALVAREPGEVWEHSESGYAFRVLVADFTANGVAITPGLRVITNNMEWATVDPAQFMDTSILMPGGRAFDRWYYVIHDGDSHPKDRFNGERLATVAPPVLR